MLGEIAYTPINVKYSFLEVCKMVKWALSSEFGTYRLCEQRRFRWACTFVQSRQKICFSLIQAVSQEDPSDRKPDLWPLWMAGHTQLKFVMMECSKTQQLLCLTGHSWYCNDPKYLDRLAVIDPDQPEGAVWQHACHSFCIFLTHYCLVKPPC